MLFNLSATPFGRLASDPALRTTLGLLKFARRRLPPTEAAVQIRAALDQLPADDALLSACLECLEIALDAAAGEAAGVPPEDEPHTKEYLMATLVQRLLQQGKAETLLRLLMLRYGAVPDGVKARVRAAAVVDLDAWLDAVPDAPDFEAVFASRPVN